MKELLNRLRFHFRRTQFERDLDEELQHHRALQSENQSPIPLGNLTLLKEDTRSMWTFTVVEQLMQDVRYGLRAMAANKLFTTMAVISLALGIGANTAIYSLMDAILLRALPVRDPASLVILNYRSKSDAPVVHSHWGSTYDDPNGGVTSPNFPWAAYEILRDNRSLSSLFAHIGGGRANLVVDGHADLAEVRYVSGQYFTELSVPSAAGRLIGPDDDRVGAPLTAVITNDYWRTRFNANPATIGKVIQINNIPVTIAGVAAPNFFGVAPAQKPAVFLPMAAILQLSDHGRPATFTDKNYYWIEMMGRLKPGVTLAQAQSELAGLFHNFVASTASTDRERADLPHLFLQEGGSGVDGLRRDYAKSLWVLMGMVALILAIACANIANLLLARATARRREMAVRLSLGAGRFRVIRQLLTESLMLALMGAIAGTGVAALGIRALLRLLTNGDDDFSLNVGLDWRVLGFALLVALVTGILFGLAPAIQATRVDVIPALKETRAGQPRRHRTPFNLRQALVVTQVALSLLLVSAAGLFVRSLNQLNSVQLGFNSQNVLLFNLDARQAGYPELAAIRLYAELETRFRRMPGVVAATSSDLPLVGGWMHSTGIEVPGIPKPPDGQRGPQTASAQVGATFFETMRIPIALGRALDARDTTGAPNVAVVNEVFAKKYFPGRSPVGSHFQLGSAKDGVDMEIVGVARNARYNSLKHDIPAVTYVPWAQNPGNRVRGLFFELRTTGDPLLLVNSVGTVVHEVAPQLPVADVTTQQRRIQGTIREERIFARLCAVFGALALLMACIGLYGSMAWTVARRTSEIGIRMALGAQRPGIVWMVLREVFALTAVGLAIGGIAVWQTTSLLKSFLFNLKPTDPVTLAAAVCILLASALVAGYLPARRAARIDPMVALRHE